MIREADYNIVGGFGAEYRGIVQYYLLAGDVHPLHRLRWVMEISMLKTLAGKHRSTVSKMAARYKAKIVTPHGPRRASRPASRPSPTSDPVGLSVAAATPAADAEGAWVARGEAVGR